MSEKEINEQFKVHSTASEETKQSILSQKKRYIAHVDACNKIRLKKKVKIKLANGVGSPYVVPRFGIGGKGGIKSGEIIEVSGEIAARLIFTKMWEEVIEKYTFGGVSNGSSK